MMDAAVAGTVRPATAGCRARLGPAIVFVVVCVLARAEAGRASDTSPAEQQIAQARRAIAAAPHDGHAHNALALGLARRARETSDPDYYGQAEAALREARRLAPDNLESERLAIWVLLGKHEFAPALVRARALNKRVPDDVLVYGLITDAAAELGEYAEAERAAQWMLDMRPGNVPGLTRAAYLRELFGDVDGALDLMQMAFQRTPALEVEDRAWILSQIGHLYLSQGKLAEAEGALQQALVLFPGYHYALGTLAKVRGARGKFEDAVVLQQERYRTAKHPENLFALGQALRRSRRMAEARAAFSEFEQRARAEMDRADNANRELIFYYVDYVGRPTEALSVALKETARRRDVHTLDAYAWALYANGKYADARKQIQAALAVGIRDPDILFHAGTIAAGLKDAQAAKMYLNEAIRLAPGAEWAGAARKTLVRLSSPRIR
jgi:tetratricopeptide (TPR) repeat protein